MGYCFEVSHNTYGASDSQRLNNTSYQVHKELQELKLRFLRFLAGTAPSVTS